MEDFHGRLLDTDSHLQIPPREWDEALGPTFAGIIRSRIQQSARATQILNPPEPAEPDPQNVWKLKMLAAAGATNATKRLRTLDLMGIEKQMLFPMAVPASMMLSAHPEAREVARRHNDYVLEWAVSSAQRLRPVTVLNMFDRAEALAEAQRVVAKGTYAVNIGCGRPPAGLSPADEAWEPLWALLEEAGVPVVLHIGGEYRFVDPAWGDTTNLRPGHTDEPLDGETVGPFSLAVTPFGPQAFLAAMILDGVLERHPRLRIGVIEMTAQWVGPFAEMLDQKLIVFKRLSGILSLKPSEYFSRQIRVTPFWWEPVGTYIERYGLDDVYVFSTDFPHAEGGTEPLQRFWQSLAGHSDDVFEKFFVENAKLIL
jgi:predicted TIM-barrel fold metal-dependent hydrolase